MIDVNEEMMPWELSTNLCLAAARSLAVSFFVVIMSASIYSCSMIEA